MHPNNCQHRLDAAGDGKMLTAAWTVGSAGPAVYVHAGTGVTIQSGAANVKAGRHLLAKAGRTQQAVTKAATVATASAAGSTMTMAQMQETLAAACRNAVKAEMAASIAAAVADEEDQ